MRRVEPRQLTFVFADSPEGGKGSRKRDESRGRPLSIIIIGPGLDSRARTALEHMLESVVSARGKVLRTNFSATSRVTRATKLTQAASRHSYRWCSPPTRGSATTFAVGDGRCVTALKLGVSLFSPKWQRSS